MDNRLLLYYFVEEFNLKYGSEEYKRLENKLSNLSISLICEEIMIDNRELKNYYFIMDYIRKYILGDISNIRHIIDVGNVLIDNTFIRYINGLSDLKESYVIESVIMGVYNINVDEDNIYLFFKETGLDLRSNIDLFCTMLGSSNNKIRIAKEIYVNKKDEYDSKFMNFVINLVLCANGDNHALAIKKLLLTNGDKDDCIHFSSFDLGVREYLSYKYKDELPYEKYLKSITNACGEEQLEYVIKLYESEGVSMRNINDRLSVIEYAMIISQTKDRNVAKYIYEIYFKYPFIIGVKSDRYINIYGDAQYYVKCLKKISLGNCIEKVKIACEYFEGEIEKKIHGRRIDPWVINKGVEIILGAKDIPQAKVVYRVMASNKVYYQTFVAKYVSQAVGCDQAHAACLFYFSPLFSEINGHSYITEKITKMDSFVEMSKLINSYGVFPITGDIGEELDDKDYELMFRVVNCGVDRVDYDKKKTNEETSVVDENTSLFVNDSKKRVRSMSDRIKNFFSR